MLVNLSQARASCANKPFTTIKTCEVYPSDLNVLVGKEWFNDRYHLYSLLYEPNFQNPISVSLLQGVLIAYAYCLTTFFFA